MLDRFGYIVNLVAIVYVVVRPVSSNVVLLSVLALWGGTSFLRWMVQGARVDLSSALLFSGLISVGSIYTMFGFARSNPGALNGLLVYVAAPMLFGAVAVSTTRRDLLAIRRGLDVSIPAVSVIVIGLAAFGSLSFVDPIDNATIVTGSGLTTSIRFVGLSSLVAGVPYLIGRSLQAQTSRSRLRLGLSVLVGVVAVVASGRRGAWIALVAVLVVWGLGRAYRSASTNVTLGVLVLSGCIVFVLPGLASQVFSALLSLLGLGSFDPERSFQAGVLVGEFADRPLFGAGFGAVIDGYARSVERPWNFELQYHLLLFQTGIVGVVLYASLWTRAAREWFRAALPADSLFWPSMWSFGAIVIANASNPYLQAPGHMWALYLPAIVVSAHKRAGSNPAVRAQAPHSQLENESIGV